MNQITAARIRIDDATDLPALLDAACAAFGTILAVLRHHQPRSGPAFPAFVLAAGAAASGRDQICRAASLPPAATPGPPVPAPADSPAVRDLAGVAIALAGLGQALAESLSRAADTADSRDRNACLHAARYAARVHLLLAGAGRT